MSRKNMPAGPGRPKGSKNKLPRGLKEKVLAVAELLEEQGKSLEDEALKDPPWFYVNFIKPMLPKDVVVSGSEESPLITEIVIKHVKPDVGAAGENS